MKAKEINEILFWTVGHEGRRHIEQYNPELGLKEYHKHLLSLAGFYFKKYGQEYADILGSSIGSNDDTIPFLAIGGFERILELEEREGAFKNQVFDVNQSVLETNASIQRLNSATAKSLYWQKYLTVGNLLVSAVALAVSIIAVTKNDSTELKIQNTILKMQVRVLDSIHRTLKTFQEAPVAKDSVFAN